jgi:hypothetical protein
MNVVAAIACKCWHFGQAVEGVDLAAFGADGFGTVTSLEKMLQTGIVRGVFGLKLL